MPGVVDVVGVRWTLGPTRCSTSATVTFAAVAITGLKLRAGLPVDEVAFANRLFQAWMIARSATRPRLHDVATPHRSREFPCLRPRGVADTCLGEEKPECRRPPARIRFRESALRIEFEFEPRH